MNNDNLKKMQTDISLTLFSVCLIILKYSITEKNKFFKIFNFHLFSANGNPILASNLLIAIILLYLSFSFSNFLSKFFVQKFMKNSELDIGAKKTVQNLLYYTFLIFFVLATLNIANIPITVFAFLGGALAIGIGFGSQALVSNFISGIIIQIERPVKIDDYVEIEGISGVITKIGMRSTTIHSTNDTDIIIPNSVLLDKKVTNWKLSNENIRCQVIFGASPNISFDYIKNEIEDLINMKKFLSCKIVFLDFNENLNIYGIMFWTKVSNNMEKIEKESEIRGLINSHFRKKDISISLPKDKKEYNF